MRFEHVYIESVAHHLPERVLTSAELEGRLAPLYERLRLQPGRFELMSGIRERRHFAPGTRPSQVAARAGQLALQRSGIERARIGCLINASVCRDFLEPSTASVVHHALELPSECTAFDLSNACLGFANAMMQVAGMIERGAIEAGLIVSGEDGGPLVEQTVRALLERGDKQALKLAFASLTIGSGAAAMVLAHESLVGAASGGDTKTRQLLGGIARADTSSVELCQGDHTDGGGPLMQTDSEGLLQAGNALAARTWEAFQAEFGWSATDVDRVVTHQVGVQHRRLLFDTLGLDAAKDFPTVETLGNIGSVSLPLSLSMAEEQGVLRPRDRIAMLGIGSGLHCLMMAVR